jgi:hypothetical protein
MLFHRGVKKKDIYYVTFGCIAILSFLFGTRINP